MTQPFAQMSDAEARRFMYGNAHPIRERVAELVDGREVIDLGCGRGIHVRELYDSYKYAGIDCSEALVNVARDNNPGFYFAVSDIIEYLRRVPDSLLGVGIMVSVLEHVDSLETARAIYDEARRACRTLYVGWHHPPRYPKTEILKVKAELDEPIWQNHYAEGTFAPPVAVEKILHAELWTVRG